MSREAHLELLAYRPLVNLLCWGLVSLLTIISFGPVTQAAEYTIVADAAEDDNPFDFIGEVFYRRHLRRAKITREYNCDPSNANDAMICPGAPAGGQLLHLTELRYARYTHEVVPRARFGLYKDLELWIEAPITIEDTQEVRFAGNGGDSDKEPVTSMTSSISPATGEQLFNVPDNALMSGLPKRAGFGDMMIKLRYALISQERDPTRGEWVVEVGYRAPTGEVMKPRPSSTGGVGRGVHELSLATAFSQRFSFVEPYARFEANLPLGSTVDSPFKRYWGSQDFVLPGARGRFDVGAEIIPFENPDKGIKIFIDLGLGAAYQAEGRDYSELFDALAIGGQTCNPSGDQSDPASFSNTNCASYNRYARPEGMAVSQAPELFDGVTTVEDFVTVRGHIGFGVYASEFFKIGANLALAHETEHNISNAEIGKDIFNTPGQEGVMIPAADNQQRSEHNPTFVPAIDTLGKRIRVQETTVFTLSAYLGLMF